MAAAASKSAAMLGKDSQSVSKRLQNELMTLMMASTPGISAFPESDNLQSWVGTITGPVETVYDGLTYKLSLDFPDNYPYSAPTVKFTTPCYHPNVDQSGNICLDILKENWSAVYNVSTILLSIQSLLGEPNNESPLNGQAAQLWDDQVEYKKVMLQKYKEAIAKSL
eukprot:Partr_v1_DN23699_c0_g1_i1_m18823 putative ubiquitin-conjugating enzyme